MSDQQTLGFQAEVKQIMHLVTHALYSHKEIFLRELISNASDALDKLRFAALSNNDLYENNPDLSIHINFDEKAKTLTIRDTGIGMSKQEVMDNLGTIAKSGTKEFLSQLTGEQAKDSQLIGQFGVGFYSAFIVADKVTVNTRKAGEAVEQGVRWVSAGEGEYSIETVSKSERGTEIILHLKDDETEFLSDYRLRDIINKYSNHINWPIYLPKKPEPAAEGEEQAAATDGSEEEKVNEATALWTLQKNEIKEEEYKEFYKHISHDFADPLLWAHNHVEGKQDYISLLYVPTRAPFDLYQQDKGHGLKLYVKRVFIMDDADQFMPRYLRFVKGVIDASDLPLNVSRELLQDNKTVNSIKAACTKRVLSAIQKLANNDAEKFASFWKEFGQVLKEGVIEDFSNKDDIAKLLRFASTHNDNAEQTVSLEDYVGRMQEGQKHIYYITAESYNAAKSSPHLEIFRKKGIEVLLLSDRIDEWLVSHLSEFDGKHLSSITKGELDLGELDEEVNKEQQEQQNKDFASMLEQIKGILNDKIEEVRLTNRLTDSPACVVAGAHDMGREMQRILEAAGQNVPMSKPIFEINPEHPLVQRLQAETDDDRFGEWTHIIFDQALLAEGAKLDNPSEFVQRLNRMLLQLAGA